MWRRVPTVRENAPSPDFNVSRYLDLFHQFDPPIDSFEDTVLGERFAEELAATSHLWFRCGYRPGIAAYLNFFLLRDFITLHDSASPPRFASFRSMADSFYRTDLFVREVTDSGMTPTGGISSPRVRAALRSIMDRHRTLSIPNWMMTCFGFSLLEMVEKQCAPTSAEQQQLHLAYMSKAFRIMGIPFLAKRGPMEEFSRAVEEAHAGLSTHAERHTRDILMLAEAVGVSSTRENIGSMLPHPTRVIFESIYDSVRPNLTKRWGARLLGRLVMKRAVGTPRTATPFNPGEGSNEARR